MASNSQELLGRTHELRKKHGVEEYEEPFNVFSVLFKDTDEVNLHSRFFAALLEYHANVKGGNLDSFLRRVLSIDDFDLTAVTIKREYSEIDILVSNSKSKQAVIIENKILAVDQKEQLKKYYKILKSQGFHKVYLVYLTLDGRDPSPQSVGDLPCIPISYKADLLPWLTCCQQRAHDLPSLRESIVQYIRILRRLTGDNIEGSHMKDLIDLCLEGDNLVLVHDLNQAMKKAQIILLHRLWKEIEEALDKTIPDLPTESSWAIVTPKTTVDDAVQTPVPNIEEFVEKQSTDLVLRFPFDGVNGGVGIGAGMTGTYYGVYCHKSNETQHKRLLKLLGWQKNPSDRWPWYQYSTKELKQKSLSREQLIMLIDSNAKSKYVNELVSDFKDLVWERVKETGVGQAVPFE